MKMISKGGSWPRLPMPARTVSRADLYQALRDEAVRRGVPIEYGKRLATAELTRDGVRARFADGTAAEGDLLIGADGLRSVTRTIIDPRAPRPRHVGLLNVGGYARGMGLLGEPGAAHFVFGRRCFFGYMVHPDGEVWWFANPPSRREPARDELLAITSEQWRARLVELFRDDTGPMLDIIAASEEIFPGWNTYDFPRVPTWYNRPMVIIGDAAHATSPSSGQGASMAIEDAVVLAKCLRDIPDTAGAFAAFKGLRQERVERVVKHGKRSGDGKAQGRSARRSATSCCRSSCAAWRRGTRWAGCTTTASTGTNANSCFFFFFFFFFFWHCRWTSVACRRGRAEVLAGRCLRSCRADLRPGRRRLSRALRATVG